MTIDRLLDIMARLRDPERGCPWDREQSWASIAPHTIEEAYELADAIGRGDVEQVRDELGDLLFQVVFQARIAAEQGLFAFVDVANSISDKLERRHPHVFGEATIGSAAEQTVAWEKHKAEERRAQGGQGGVLDGVALGLPALTRAAKLGRRAAQVGFDWPDTRGVLDKVREELDELERAHATGHSGHVREELGDLLFSLAQLARHLQVDPEGALRDAGGKFRGLPRRHRLEPVHRAPEPAGCQHPGRLQHHVYVGGEYSGQQVRTFQRALGFLPAGDSVPAPSAASFTPWAGALYVEMQARSNDLALTAGMRYDQFSGRDDLKGKQAKTQRALGPRMAVSTGFRGVTFVASFGKFRPAPDYQYLVDAAFDDTTRTGRSRQGNPDLGFEESTQYEFSLRVPGRRRPPASGATCSKRKSATRK